MLTRRLCRATTSAVLAIGIALTGITTMPTHAAPDGVAVPAFWGGTAVGWGEDLSGRAIIPASLSGKTVTAVSAGYTHSVALTSDGKVTAWGNPDFGKTAIPDSLNSKTVTAISAGGMHSLALTSDGKITAWGGNDADRITIPASLSGRTVTAVSAGSTHSLAVTSDGKVTAWGNPDFGKTAIPDSLNNKTVTAVAAGTFHSLALTSDGKVAAWGDPDLGNTNIPDSLNGKTVTAISAGLGHSMALTSDGKVVAWGDPNSSKATVPESLNSETVTAIAAGSAHSMVLTGNGKVIAWGYTEDGRATVPASLTGRIVTAIAADNHSLAIATDFAAEAAPTVTGTPTAGSTLTAVPSRYTSEPDTLRYQWYADGLAVPGANAPRLTLTPSHNGKRITVWVTATKAGHPTVVTSSAPLGPVVDKKPAITLTAAKSTLRRGQATTLTWTTDQATTLTATGAWTGPRAATGTIQVKPTAIGTTTYVLTGTNAAGTTTAQAQIKVTRPATRLKITAPKGNHRPGTKITVKIRGLEAGERYTLRIGKRKVATGTAKNNRPLAKKIKLPQTTGKAILRVTGDQPDRTGTAKLPVVRR